MKLVIIGNGITGLTAARVARKRLPGATIQIISEEHDFPYSRTALMYVFMGHVTLSATECYARDFYSKNSLELIKDRALRADTSAKRVLLASGRILEYDALLIATGSKSARYGWPGETLAGVQGLYSLQDLELLERTAAKGLQHAVIVGGGLIGIELAEMLHSRGVPVSMLVRESSYASHILPPEESSMVNREIKRHGIDLLLSSNLKEIKGENGRATSVVSDTGAEIPCDFVGLTTGVTPNVDFARASNVDCARGVLVNDQFKTGAYGVFAAGDCAQFQNADGTAGRVEQLWYTGRIQGNRAGSIISDALEGKRLGEGYKPGVFFNSAKFFTIEYQIYGTIPASEPSVLMVDEQNNRLIRISYSRDGATCVLGFSLMGVRYRHEVCARWIEEKRSIEYVLDHLSEANFDPEFSRRYESAVKAEYKKVAV
ncbi:MAG: NAD(P)/FAD-dependent oxidoreductase [Leptospirales bacterium]|nr:NAD(P)/FAD-dependent oxidoreductase [Leptospirales bacterium]